MKVLIIIMILFNIGFVFAFDSIDEPGLKEGTIINSIKETLSYVGGTIKNFFVGFFSWTFDQLKNLWSKIIIFLDKEIDTRKGEVEEKIEEKKQEITDNVKESLLERFKRIIRYND